MLSEHEPTTYIQINNWYIPFQLLNLIYVIPLILLKACDFERRAICRKEPYWLKTYNMVLKLSCIRSDKYLHYLFQQQRKFVVFRYFSTGVFTLERKVNICGPFVCFRVLILNLKMWFHIENFIVKYTSYQSNNYNFHINMQFRYV